MIDAHSPYEDPTPVSSMPNIIQPLNVPNVYLKDSSYTTENATEGKQVESSASTDKNLILAPDSSKDQTQN